MQRRKPMKFCAFSPGLLLKTSAPAVCIARNGNRRADGAVRRKGGASPSETAQRALELDFVLTDNRRPVSLDNDLVLGCDLELHDAGVGGMGSSSWPRSSGSVVSRAGSIAPYPTGPRPCPPTGGERRPAVAWLPWGEVGLSGWCVFFSRFPP